MNPIFKKLNFKDQQRIAVLHAPAEFEQAMKEMQELTQLDATINPNHTYEFVLAFVQSEADIEKVIANVHTQLAKDPVFWLAYPKKSSKKYKSTLHRDCGWKQVGALGFESVRQIAINEDWSALRFRDASFIKAMKRDASRAMSQKGKERVK